MTRDEPTDEEVNAAIDALADKAKRGIYGTTGYAWDARAEVDRLARLLKGALNTPAESDPIRAAVDDVLDPVRDAVVAFGEKLAKEEERG